MFLDATDHLAVYKGCRRGVVHFELDAPGLAVVGYVEVLVAIEDFLGVVGVGAAVQDGERARAEQGVEAALASVQELADLLLGEVFEGAAGTDPGVDKFRNEY